MVYVYWPEGIPSLGVAAVFGATVTTCGYIRARKVTAPPRSSPEPQSFSLSHLMPLMGFVVVYAGLILAGTAIGEAFGRTLPDDDPVELGAVIGGGLAGAMVGISVGARTSRVRRL